jgi:hypothetical protein
MSRSILQQHHEDQALNDSLLQFVNNNPEQAANLLRLAWEEVQLDEEIKRLESKKVEIRKKTTISAAKALKQLEDYNTPGFTDDDDLIGRGKQSIIRNLMKLPSTTSPIEKRRTKRGGRR